jgi:uncharacterized protein with von Willebrand factor type A (vWA) domain
MQIDKIKQAATEAQEDINIKYSRLFKLSFSLKELVAAQFSTWMLNAKTVLVREFPLAQHAQKLIDWKMCTEGEFVNKSRFSSAIFDFYELCDFVKHPRNESFWEQQLEDTITDELSGKPCTIGSQLLATEWQKLLDKANNEWELIRLGELRSQFTEKLEGLMELLQQLQPVTDLLGVDSGFLFDLTDGQLTPQNFAQFQWWSKYLAEDQGLQSLCELLGKMRQIELSERRERVKINHTFDIYVPDINSREEIVGIRLGRDLEHVLPSEKALLADEDTAILFDLKYVESRLMSFEMQGLQLQQTYDVLEVEQLVSYKEERGPMVICVDTSGSMQGAPETIAKAVSLFLAAKARNESRSCYLINFSTGIQTLELTSNLGITDIIDFLKMSFYGGTDVAPALNHALDIMKNEKYQKADLLIISDFIMADLPQLILDKIELQRAYGNRFYSLVVEDTFMRKRLKSFFDQEWVYNPRTTSIHELIGYQQYMSRELEA